MPEHAAPNKIGVSEIGEFVRFESCERRLKLAYNDRAIGKDLPHSERLFNTLDPILQQMGAESEAFWEKNLQEEGFYTIPQGEEGLNLKQVLSAFSGIDPGTNAYAREVTLEWTFGSFRTTGRADFITLMWNEGTPIIRIVEGKASRKDRTYHRIQLATYILITRNLINEETYNINGHEIDPDFIEGTVVRIDKDTNAYQNIVSTPPLNLDTEISDVERLFSSTGLLERVSQAPLDSLSFQISTKCDGCVFSVHCLPESARQRRLELLGITPSVVRALNRREIKTLDALAGIDLQSDLASSVVADEDFDENLTQLQAKAKARLSTLPDKEAPELKGYTVETLPNQGLSQLPLHTMGENRLIRVYLSVHYDYSENRLGAISAHISSSDFEISTPFETTQESQYRPAAKIEEKSESSTRDIQNASSKDIAFVQPSKWTRSLEEDTASERALLEQFFQELLESITEIAQSSHAPVHFYVYTRSEMTQLIEACSRCGSRLLGHLRELLGCCLASTILSGPRQL